MNFLPAIYTEAEPADIIVKATEGTYIGRYDRANFDPERPAESQPIWNIHLVAIPDENTIRNLYPEGSRQYKFVWDNRDSYNYKYSL